MIYPNFTTYAISSFTHRHCVRFTEMAFVVVAIFDAGRPQFISKKKLHEFVCRQECLNGAKLQTEWKIGQKPQITSADLSVIAKRLEKAGFERIEIESDRVVGMVPGNKSDQIIALQIAKESNWRIQGHFVVAS